MTASAGSRPFVTVMLPIRNEASGIGRCLEAILEQDYPRDRMEILVADGMSEDATRAVVAGYASRDPRVRILDNPGRIVPTGLNAAVRASRGEIVVRVDGHTLVERDYVSEGVAALERSGADIVGGTMRPVGRSAFGRAVAAATSTRMGVGGSAFHYASEEQDAESVYMGTFRRDVFSRFGFFDERCTRNQDDEFNYRVRERGGRVRLVPSMRSTYAPRESARALYRQYFQYGYYKVLVLSLHPRAARPRHLAPSLFVLALAALGIGAAASPLSAMLLGGAIASHAALSLGLGAKASKGDLAAAALVPAATLLIHAGYGLGFLAGGAAALRGRITGSTDAARRSAA